MGNEVRSVAMLTAMLVILNIAANAQSVGNAGFEVPALSGNSFLYNPATGAGQPWNFQLDAGIARSDPNFFEATGTTDGQFAFLQSNNETNGLISQTINFSTSGLFQLSYLEAGRVANGQGAFGDLSYNIYIESTSNNIFNLDVNDSSASGQPFTLTTYSFNIPAPGDYVLSFSGLNAPHNDDTAFFDNIAINAVPEFPAALLLLIGSAMLLTLSRSWLYSR
jgi:hypothetical protein